MAMAEGVQTNDRGAEASGPVLSAIERDRAAWSSVSCGIVTRDWMMEGVVAVKVMKSSLANLRRFSGPSSFKEREEGNRETGRRGGRRDF